MINGKDVLMYVQDGSEWLPYLCSTDVRIRLTVDILSKTTKGSGSYRSYYSRKKAWSVSFSGISGVAEWSVFDSIENLGNQVNIKIEFTDSSGTVKTFAGSVIMGDLEIGSSAEDLSDYTHEMQGTGAFSLDGEIIGEPGGGTGFDYTLDFTITS